MTQAHVRFPENLVRPPDDYSDLEESYALVTVSPDSPSLSLTQDVLQHEVVSPDSPSLTQEKEAIPDHYFEVNVIKGKTGAMKGKTRETVSLLIGNHIFRKKNTLNDGTIKFSCNGCERKKKTVSAFASINENGNYELLEWPHSEDHRCWVDGTEALVRQARQKMFKKVDQDPSRSINKIYEEVRVSFTENLDGD